MHKRISVRLALIIFICTPMTLTLSATIVALLSSGPSPQCTLSWQLLILSYVPSILAFLLAVLGLVIGMWKKIPRIYLLGEVATILVTLTCGFIVNVLLTFCP